MDKNPSKPSAAGGPSKPSEDQIQMPLKEFTLLFSKFLSKEGYRVSNNLSINLIAAASSSGRRPPTDPSVRRYEGKIEVVIRGVPHEFETDIVQDDLEDQGYPVYDVHNMYRGDGTALHWVMVILLNTDKAKKIFTDLKTVCRLNVTVACPYKGKYYGECRRCWMYGHAADECGAPFYNIPDPDSVNHVDRETGILANLLGVVAMNSSRQAPANSDRDADKKNKSCKEFTDVA